MYYVYKITNAINGRYYIGVHLTEYFNDGYMGSGLVIKRAIAKYGIDAFHKEILFSYDTVEEAYTKEKELVNPNDPLSYNLNEGGRGGFAYINSLGLPPVMHNPETVRKVVEAGQKTRNKNKPLYDEISRNNLKKSHERRKGAKDSEATKKKRGDSIRRYNQTYGSSRKGCEFTEEHKNALKNIWTPERKAAQSKRMKEYREKWPDKMGSKGAVRSPDFKEKLSKATGERQRRLRKIRVVCPHCNKEGVEFAMKRWHFAKCKLNKENNGKP